ncbi:MAG: hypothetical protein JEY96_14070 [Bacteroidales bacterium]|nr:hypothetical protein [Bacteroidales bacterium]
MVRFFSIIFLFCCMDVYSQVEFIFIKEIKTESTNFTTDQLGNIFLLKDGGITKINATNNKQKTYSNNLFGKISRIDASDPFRILVFSKDFNKILFLDNNLSEIASPIELYNLGYYNVSSVCQSNSGGFWLFDQNLNELVYFNRNLKQEKRSSQITSLLNPDIEINEVFMEEKNDYIYLGIEGEGVLLFDIYGTYIKTFPLKEICRFQIIDGNIIYLNKDVLNIYQTKNFNKDILDLPIENSINARIIQKNILVLTNDKLIEYQLNNIK